MTQYAGFRLWLDDGSTLQATTPDALQSLAVPHGRGVVYFAAYLNDTYRTWIVNAQGQNEQVTRHYVHHAELTDYFWYDPNSDTIGGGAAEDVPSGLPVGFQKDGKIVLESTWRPLYDVAYEITDPPA